MTTMADHIDYETRTDRELLLLVAHVTNLISEYKLPSLERRLESMRDTIRSNELRIIRIETETVSRQQRNGRKWATIAAGITTGLCSFLYLAGYLMRLW
jgi:hypothetical protein